MRDTFSLKDIASSMWGCTRKECVALQASDNEQELLETIYRAYEALQGIKRMVLIEGTHKGADMSQI